MANKGLKRPLKSVNMALLKIMLDAAPPGGDYIEFGVWLGDSFGVIYDHAQGTWRKVHAVDTFCGTPISPIKADNDRWPQGSFNTGDLTKFSNKFPSAQIHEGAVPDILEQISVDWLAFAHLDMDHEFSTKAALEWCWPRMVDQGILMVHDYKKGATCHAGKAVDDWMKANDLDYVMIDGSSIIIRKGVS